MIPDPEGVRAIRGLLTALPLGVALWAAVLLPIWSLR